MSEEPRSEEEDPSRSDQQRVFRERLEADRGDSHGKLSSLSSSLDSVFWP